jgi:hypothetical protein
MIAIIVAWICHFIAGMLSKSRGHVLRVSAVLHVLFSSDTEGYAVSSEVSEAAVTAAANFVMVTCQQTAFIAGRGLLSEEVERFKTGMFHISIQLWVQQYSSVLIHCIQSVQYAKYAMYIGKKFHLINISPTPATFVQ